MLAREFNEKLSTHRALGKYYCSKIKENPTGFAGLRITHADFPPHQLFNENKTKPIASLLGILMYLP